MSVWWARIFLKHRYPVDWRSHGRPEYARRYSWRAMLSPYVKDRAVFSCPSNPEADGFARSFHTPPYSSELPDGEGNDLSGGYGMNCVHREPGPPDPPGWAGGSIPRPITEGDIVAPCALIVFGDVQSNNHEITRWSNRTGFARRDADPKSTGCEKRRSLFRHTLPGGGATLHHGSANYCYADGHVKWLRPERIPCTREECWWSVQGKH